MHVFLKPAAQDKLSGLGVTLADIERVVAAGAKRQVVERGVVVATLYALEVTYRQEGDDILVEDVVKRKAPGIRGTSSPF